MIFNIAMILGVAALVFPLVVRPAVAFVAGPGLAAISLYSLWVLRDGICSRMEACLFSFCCFSNRLRAAVMAYYAPPGGMAASAVVVEPSNNSERYEKGGGAIWRK